MSYTTSGQPQGTAREITNFIRESMIGELIAINDYSCNISIAPSNEIENILKHIMKEEKRHYGMLLELLRKFDPIEFEKAVETSNHVKIKKNPLSTLSKPAEKSTLFLNEIRKNIKSELEAIISYEDIISKLEDTETVKVLQEITNEEKKHVEELTYLLIRLDKDSYGPLRKVF